MEKKEYVLDGLKGIAACVVAFMWHYQHFGPMGEESPFFSFFPLSFNFGYLMVELFFVLSGFGMMMGYKNKIMANQISFAPYFKKRVSKGYPLHFTTLILVSIIGFIYVLKTGVTFVYPNFDIYHFFLNVFLLQDGIITTAWSFNSPSWCISIFMVLYVLFYFVVRNSKKDADIIIKFVVIMLLGLVLVVTQVNYPVFNELIGRGIACFSIGVLLYYIYINKEKLNKKLIGYGSLIISLILYFTIRFTGITYVGNLKMLFIMVIAPALVLSILFVKPLNIFLQTKPFLVLGSISMEIYLLHFPVQYLLKTIDTYCNLKLNFASKKVWLLYVFCVFLVVFIYKKFVAKKVDSLFARILQKN